MSRGPEGQETKIDINENEKVDELQQKANEVYEMMKGQMASQIARSDNIEQLQANSNQLNVNTEVYKGEVSSLRRKYWLQKYKFYAIGLILILLIIIIIIAVAASKKKKKD
ncbi:MAG: hypothetical protein MHPSP_003042 [Paramarteilia canceri]